MNRRLAISVRPTRVGVIVGTGAAWRHAARRVTEGLSRKWGGIGDVIVPLDGESVPEPFLDLLAEFDPDRLAVFARTLRAHQMADPQGFEKWLDEVSARDAKADGLTAAQIKDAYLRDLDSPLAPHYSPAGPLVSEIERRLAPFRRGTLLVGMRLLADQPITSPLTDMLGLRDLPSGEIHQLDASGIDEDLDLMLSARFGRIAPGYEKALADRGIQVIRKAADPIDVPVLIRLALAGTLDPGEWGLHQAFREASGQELAVDPPWAHPGYGERTAFGWTAYHCGWRQYIRKLPLEWPYALVIGDQLTDFALALILHRLTAQAAWIPARLVTAAGDIADDVRHEVIDFLDQWSRRTGEQAHVVSTNLSPEDLETHVDALRAARRWHPPGAEDVVAKSVSDLRRGWPRRLYEERPEEFRYEPFEDGVMLGTVGTPQPSVVGTDPEKVTWHVDVRIDELHYPVRTAVSDLLAVGDVEHHRVRSGAEGTTYHSHALSVFTFSNSPLEQRLARPRLRAPTAEEVLQHLLNKTGLRGVRSDAGRFTQQTLDRFGGFDALLTALRSPISGPMLEAYRSETRSGVDPGVFLDGVRRRFLSFRDMARAAKLHDVPDFATLRATIDEYVRRGILLRGLALQCPVCHYAGWFRLADLDAEVTCQRCRQSWSIAQPTWKLPKEEPRWHYELDGVVFQAIAGNIRAPMLALDLLRQKRSPAFLFAPEMDVYRRNDLVKEIDIWAIVDGRMSVGEAKTTDALARQGRDAHTAARLFEVANAVSAEELVIATTEAAWQPRSRAAVQAEAKKFPRIELRIIEGLK